MLIPYRVIALMFRIGAALVAAWGIIIQTGLNVGEFNAIQFAYFTMQSNLIVMVYFVALVFWTARDVRRDGARGVTAFPGWLTGMVLSMIATTGLVYNLVLAPTLPDTSQYAVYSLADTLIHVVVPILVVIDWLFFNPIGGFKWRYPLLWLIIPAAYLTYAMIRANFGTLPGIGGEVGSRYPYFFIDVDDLGVQQVVINSFLLGFAYLILGYIEVVIDRVLRRPQPQHETAHEMR